MFLAHALESQEKIPELQGLLEAEKSISTYFQSSYTLLLSEISEYQKGLQMLQQIMWLSLENVIA